MKRPFALMFLTICVALAIAAPSMRAAAVRAVANSQTFQDSTAENPLAPDITTVTVSNDDNGQITLHATVANRPAFTGDMRGYLYFDTDGNTTTGSSDWYGADYSIRFYLSNGMLFASPYQWYGNGWILFVPNSPFTYNYDGTGLTVSIADSDLANARVPRFLLHMWAGVTLDPFGNLDFSNGHDDYAPDNLLWPYRVVMPDRVAPRAQALTATGRHGRPLKLRFRLSDDSGQAREQLSILKGGRQVWRKTLPLHTVSTTRVESAVWPVPRSASGRFRFCVQAWDAAGNASSLSCSSITVS